MGWNTSAFFFENSSTGERLGVLPDIMCYNPLNEGVDFETASSAKITGITFEELSKTPWHQYSADF